MCCWACCGMVTRVVCMHMQVLVKAGTVACNGVLMLEPCNITVLGGDVVHMLEEFRYERTLHRALGYVLICDGVSAP